MLRNVSLDITVPEAHIFPRTTFSEKSSQTNIERTLSGQMEAIVYVAFISMHKLFGRKHVNYIKESFVVITLQAA